MRRSERYQSNDFTIFAGTANPVLAAAIARELGVQLSACAVNRFPDAEVAVQLLALVRRKAVILVQPTSPLVNDDLIELLALADAYRRAAAAQITAVVPYFGYARADKRHGRREPITGRAVADLLEPVGIGNVVTVDRVRVATEQRIRLIDFVWASFAFVLHSVFMTLIAQNMGRTHAGPRTLPAGEVSFSASPSRIYIYTLSFKRTSWSIATERP